MAFMPLIPVSMLPGAKACMLELWRTKRNTSVCHFHALRLRRQEEPEVEESARRSLKWRQR